MDIVSLSDNNVSAAREGLIRLHETVLAREPSRPEAALSPDELLSRFRASDPTRNAACLTWLLRTYAAGGYRLEDLSKAHDTLVSFARLRGCLPNTAIIDGETRNPRKLGSHLTLASLWKVIAPLVEVERLAQEEEAGERSDTDRERALSQSRVLYRSNRMVIAVPMTVEASCWWGQGTQWCTAARNDNAFDQYYKEAPLIVICLRKSGDLPACKLQLYVHAGDMQFMDENDEEVSSELVLERWQDLEALLYWSASMYGQGLEYIPELLRTEAICLAAVSRNGETLVYVPEPLRTKAMCTAAVGGNGMALRFVPKHLHTEAMCLVAVGRDGEALKHVSKHLRTEAMCLAAVKSNGWALEDVPKSLLTEPICLVAVIKNGGALTYLPDSLRTEAVCLAAVGRDGWVIEHAPKPLRTEAMCLAAVGSNGLALTYVPSPLRTEAICTVAVEQNGKALEFVPKLLRTEAICLAAVTHYGWALQHVPERLRTEAICTAAVGSSGMALYYLPKALRTEAMYLAAVGGNGLALKHVPEQLCTEAVCIVAVMQNAEALEFVPEPLRTEAVCLAAAGKDKQKSVSVTDETNEREPHDLVLEILEDYLNNPQPIQQSTSSVLNPVVHQ